VTRALVALSAGTLFGAGLAVSGMADPARVRAFLDIAGQWDPTLAFVMWGALVPMALAWRIRARLAVPVSAPAFAVPANRHIDTQLVVGALLFGAGWGVAGLCPGPAIAALAIAPLPAVVFILAMAAGMAVHRFTTRSTAGRAPDTIAGKP